jgi:hypothetical protein
MSVRAPVNPRHLLTWLGLLFGAGGLALQFVISMQAYLASGRDIPGALGAFFAYYTILTNCILVLIYLSEVTSARRLDLFRHPVLRGMTAACITLVSVYVFLVLRHLSELEGLFDVADRLLHYLCPVLYLMWWVVVQRHGLLRWSNLPLMLVPTLVYFLYAMARGAWVLEYPYPFMNAGTLGYPAVLQDALLMAVALAALSAVVIGLDHLLGRDRRPIIAT